MRIEKNGDRLIRVQSSQINRTQSIEEQVMMDRVSLLLENVNNQSSKGEHQDAVENLLQISAIPMNCLLIFKSSFLSESFFDHDNDDSYHITFRVELLWYWSVDAQVRKELLLKFKNLPLNIWRWMSTKRNMIELYQICENLCLEESFRASFFCLGQSTLSSLIDDMTQSRSIFDCLIITEESTELLALLWTLSVEFSVQKYLLFTHGDLVSFLITYLQSSCFGLHQNDFQKAQVACFGLLRNLSSDPHLQRMLWQVSEDQLVLLCEQYLSCFNSEQKPHLFNSKYQFELVLNVLMLLNNLCVAESGALITSTMFRPHIRALSSSLSLLYEQSMTTLPKNENSIRLLHLIVSLIHKWSVCLEIFPEWIVSWYRLLLLLSSYDVNSQDHMTQSLWKKVLGTIVHHLLIDNNEFSVAKYAVIYENVAIDDVISLQQLLLREVLVEETSEKECVSQKDAWLVRVCSDTLRFAALVMWVMNAVHLSYAAQVVTPLSETTCVSLVETQSLSLQVFQLLVQEVSRYWRCMHVNDVVDVRITQLFVVRNALARHYSEYVRYLYLHDQCEYYHSSNKHNDHDYPEDVLKETAAKTKAEETSFLSLLPCEGNLLLALVSETVELLTHSDTYDTRFPGVFSDEQKRNAHETEQKTRRRLCRTKLQLMTGWCDLLCRSSPVKDPSHDTPQDTLQDTSSSFFLFNQQRNELERLLQQQLLPTLTAFFTTHGATPVFQAAEEEEALCVLCVLWVQLLLWQQQALCPVSSPVHGVPASLCDTATTPIGCLARVFHETLVCREALPVSSLHIARLQFYVLSALQRCLDTSGRPCVTVGTHATPPTTHLPLMCVLSLYQCVFCTDVGHTDQPQLSRQAGVSLLCRVLSHLLAPLCVSTSSTTTHATVCVVANRDTLLWTVSLLLSAVSSCVSGHRLKDNAVGDTDQKRCVVLSKKEVDTVLPPVSRLLSILQSLTKDKCMNSDNRGDIGCRCRYCREDTAGSESGVDTPLLCLRDLRHTVNVETLLSVLLRHTQTLHTWLTQLWGPRDTMRHSSDTWVLWTAAKTQTKTKTIDDTDEGPATHTNGSVSSLYSSSYSSSTSSFLSIHCDSQCRQDTGETQPACLLLFDTPQHHLVSQTTSPSPQDSLQPHPKKDLSSVELELWCAEMAAWDRVSVATPDWSSCRIS